MNSQDDGGMEEPPRLSPRRRGWALVKEVWRLWFANNPFQHAAALAYFTVFSLAPLLLILLAVLAALHGIGRSRVRADDSGLDIRNGYRRHRLSWGEVRAVVMKKGAPWPTVVLKGADERHIILFAIQGSDGDAARRSVAELSARLR